MTVAPGAYLRDAREDAGLTLIDVADLIRLLRLDARSAPWFRRDLWASLRDIESDRLKPSELQLLGLRLIYPFSLVRYRQLQELRDAPATDAGEAA